MDRPEDGNDRRQQRRPPGKPLPHPRGEQAATNHREQGQRGRRMNGHIEQVIAVGPDTPQPVVEGEGQVGQRPGGQNLALRHRLPERAGQMGIPLDLVDVIEDKHPEKRVDEGDDRERRHHQGRPPRCQAIDRNRLGRFRRQNSGPLRPGADCRLPGSACLTSHEKKNSTAVATEGLTRQKVGRRPLRPAADGTIR